MESLIIGGKHIYRPFIFLLDASPLNSQISTCLELDKLRVNLSANV